MTDTLDIGVAYRQYANELTCYLRKRGASDPEDLCHTVFLEVCHRAAAYEERGELRGWLYRIAHSRLIDERRWRARRFIVPLEEWKAIADSPEDVIINQVFVQDALHYARLVPAQQRVLWLRYTRGLEPMGVATVLGITHGVAKSLQHRALARLREFCKDTP